MRTRGSKSKIVDHRGRHGQIRQSKWGNLLVICLGAICGLSLWPLLLTGGAWHTQLVYEFDLIGSVITEIQQTPETKLETKLPALKLRQNMHRSELYRAAALETSSSVNSSSSSEPTFAMHSSISQDADINSEVTTMARDKAAAIAVGPHHMTASKLALIVRSWDLSNSEWNLRCALLLS